MKTLALKMLLPCVLICLSSIGASTQNLSGQVITLVVPATAGGPSDAIARILAQSLTRELKQQVIVQNVPGAGTTTGSRQVARANPNGHTLLLNHFGIAVAPDLYPTLGLDPLKDFSPIAVVTDAAMAIAGRPGLNASDLPKLVDLLRAKGTQMTIAHGGLGGPSHLCGMLLQEAAGARMVTVPYQGTGPAITDLLGGRVDIICDQATNIFSHILSGGLKGYAVTSTERDPTLPNLPTTTESGMKGIVVSVWHGLYAPAGMDPAAVEVLANAVRVSLADQDVKDRLSRIGTRAAPLDEANPRSLRKRLQAETALWRPIFQRAGELSQQ